jgi:hypothetical protein
MAQADVACSHDGLRAVGDLQLGQDVGNVGANRFLA